MFSKSLMTFLAICISSGISSGVLAYSSAETLKLELNKAIQKSGISSGSLSLYATLNEGLKQTVVLDVNGKTVKIPASISKLATTAAVLRGFPQGHKFKTDLLSEASIAGDTLMGDLYLRGGGDPSFVSENMWYLVNAFTRTGIRKIKGDLVVDDTLFDRKRFDSSRESERVDRAYDAPVGAMSFNWNSINIFVRPGSKVGEPALVILDPQNSYTRLVNHASTMKGAGQNLMADRMDDSKTGLDLIQVAGKIGVDNKEFVIFKSITEPDLWSGENLKSFLSQRGIEVLGRVRAGATPAKAEILAESESKGVEHVLADMNKFSNNYVAEMLCKNLGVRKRPTGATLADGMDVINETLSAMNIPRDQFHLENPSGFTRENKFSSYAMWMLLDQMHNDFQTAPELLTSLPIAGVDGTLKKRMKETPAQGWVRAKTGLLNGVVALAGYAGRPDGAVVTFSFIFNGNADESKMRNLFDSLLVLLVK